MPAQCIFYYMTGSHTPHFLWLGYFMSQVPLLIVERAMLGALRRAGVEVPNLLRILATLSIQCLLGHIFFW